MSPAVPAWWRSMSMKRGDWVEVGFYIQAFRNTELSEDYTNVLTMKQLHYIKEMDAMKCAERIFQSINNN